MAFAETLTLKELALDTSSHKSLCIEYRAQVRPVTSALVFVYPVPGSQLKPQREPLELIGLSPSSVPTATLCLASTISKFSPPLSISVTLFTGRL